MAVYFLNLKTFGRSSGGSAASAAAYRAGERIRDERTGRTYDHTDRRDVMHKEILLPTEFTGAEMGWARDRATLWNAAEGAESRRNARVAREYLVALPVELTPDQRKRLVLGFSQQLSDRYRFAVDVTIHAPREFPGSDPRNYHAHLLATTREVTAEGLGAKTTLELSDSKRGELGLKPAVNELLFVRERWATVTNEALREAHVAARVDHRTLEAQGIDREPLPRIPRTAFEMERHGYRSVVAERIREDYQARVKARSEHTAAARPVKSADAAVAGPVQDAEAAQAEDPARKGVEAWLRYRETHPPITAQDSVQNWLRYCETHPQKSAQESVEAWKKYREAHPEISSQNAEAGAQRHEAQPESSPSRSRSRGRGHDFSL